MPNETTQQYPVKNTLKCFVIDDEQAAINKLESFIKVTSGLEFSGYETDPLRAKAMLSREKQLPDILFLDIEMKGPLGLKLASLVMDKTFVVFTTGHSQFAVEAYRLNALDYLMKPISYPHFLEAVARCRTRKESTDPIEKDGANLLFLKDSLSRQIIQVNKNDILYIQSIGNYCRVYLRNNIQIMPHMTLKQILSQIEAVHFVRIHKSYVINMKHVRLYEGNGIIQLANEIKLEVGRTFRKKLKEKIRQAHGN
jgi:DNA-binding LytR/AlgR family response regulator